MPKLTYQTRISMSDIEYLGIFDDLPYKQVNNIIDYMISENKPTVKKHELMLDVYIWDENCSDNERDIRTTFFTFEALIDINELTGRGIPKEFVVEKKYSLTSNTAKYIQENLTYDDDEKREQQERECMSKEDKNYNY